MTKISGADENKEFAILVIGICVASVIGVGLMLFAIIVAETFFGVGGVDLILIWLLWTFLLGRICIYLDMRNIPKEERASLSYVIGKILSGGF